jgi:hypothetical protein
MPTDNSDFLSIIIVLLYALIIMIMKLALGF